MTTYATSTAQPTLPNPAPPAPRHSQPPAYPPATRRSRAGIIIAATAFAITAAATTITAWQLAQPGAAAQNIVTVVPAPPTQYTATDIQAAKTAACTAWDQSSRATAAASRQSAAALTQSWQSPDSSAALATEKRTGLAAVSYIRTQISPATPASITKPLEDWMAARIDMLHALNVRDWAGADRQQTRGNELIGTISSECGLS